MSLLSSVNLNRSRSSVVIFKKFEPPSPGTVISLVNAKKGVSTNRYTESLAASNGCEVFFTAGDISIEKVTAIDPPSTLLDVNNALGSTPL